MAQDVTPRKAVGYSLVLPPGWYHIPVRWGSDKAIRKISVLALGKGAKALPKDEATTFRKELERRLTTLVADARRKAAIDLYLPVGLVRGMPVPASFLVSELSLNSVEEIEPELIVAELASAGAESKAVTVAGAIGARSEHTAGPDPDKQVEYGSRRVDYVVAVPGDQDRYLAVGFSTLGGGDPDDAYALVLVELFDAMMATWRWNWE